MSSDFDMEREAPSDLENFRIGIELEIGPKDQPGTELFQIQVCSYKWWETNYNEEILLDESTPIVWGRRPFLIMQHYSYPNMQRFLEQEFEKIEEENWHAIAKKINQFSIWEFDNYAM